MAVILACSIVALSVPGTETGTRVAVIAAVVGLFGGWARHMGAALLTGVIAWLFATGFLVNTVGLLTFTGPDLVRLAVLLGAAVTGGVYGARARRRAALAVDHAD
ncbi:hypothetical protein [Acrocarpospora phusangensis]|uniref:hypothetical protein n=1 Tax=Acrocarpospora phusangensis TaxID=1070424 RepID=UPI0019520EBA|nr:hypothetical protein [Acrocarpospora phusangensis]